MAVYSYRHNHSTCINFSTFNTVMQKQVSSIVTLFSIDLIMSVRAFSPLKYRTQARIIYCTQLSSLSSSGTYPPQPLFVFMTLTFLEFLTSFSKTKTIVDSLSSTYQEFKYLTQIVSVNLHNSSVRQMLLLCYFKMVGSLSPVSKFQESGSRTQSTWFQSQCSYCFSDMYLVTWWSFAILNQCRTICREEFAVKRKRSQQSGHRLRNQLAN